jgi:hypothetical protein
MKPWIYLSAGVAVLVLLAGIWGHGYKAGRARVLAQWHAAEQRQFEAGVSAREKAEASVPAEAPARSRCATRDPRDRDCAK